jgi:hypothetical protein
MARYFYQPGVYDPGKGGVWDTWWADEVTTRIREAKALARRYARQRGGIPVVGYWYQSHGDSPGPDAVIDVLPVGPRYPYRGY